MAWLFKEGMGITIARAAANSVTPARWIALRRVYHAARSLPDRLTHKRRHVLAIKRIARAPRPRRVLVVCHGNICRSPYLEAVLRQRLRDIVVTSAGFIGRGRTVPHIALGLGRERGIDLSNFRSQSLSKEKVRAADLILVMDARQARQLVSGFGAIAARIV